jgi:hypothetical protein
VPRHAGSAVLKSASRRQVLRRGQPTTLRFFESEGEFRGWGHRREFVSRRPRHKATSFLGSNDLSKSVLSLPP